MLNISEFYINITKLVLRVIKIYIYIINNNEQMLIGSINITFRTDEVLVQ